MRARSGFTLLELVLVLAIVAIGGGAPPPGATPRGGRELRSPSGQRCRSGRGFALIELLLVTAILGIVCLAAIPLSGSFREANLDAAAGEVAEALRFARSQAMALGTPYGVTIGVTDQRVRVFRVDAANALHYDVRNPVDKRLYALELGAGPAAGVSVAISDFRFGGLGSPTESVAFDSSGVPVSPDGALLLDFGQVDLVSGVVRRTVSLASRTGRVRTQ